MKAYLLGDELSIRLFALLGIEGFSPEEDVLIDMKRLVSKKDAGIVFITRSLADKIRNKAETLLRSKHPLVVEIPDIENPEFSDPVIDRISKMLGIADEEKEHGD